MTELLTHDFFEPRYYGGKTAVSVGNKQFTIAGSFAYMFVLNGKFNITGSTGNDGTYTVVSSSEGGGNIVKSSVGSFGAITVNWPGPSTGASTTRLDMKKPYYQDDAVTIYHGDCREILPDIGPVDLVLTDPPYGIADGLGVQQHNYRKSNYGGSWEDTPRYVLDVCVPIIKQCRLIAKTVCLTPGTKCLTFYPQPDDVGCFYTPASPRVAKFGFQTCHPIFYYGWYKEGGKGNSASGRILTEAAANNGHPCPKPERAWKWLLNRLSLDTGTILDPFMGSGTTLRAAKDLGRKAIGIEIEEKYCEIAAKRMAQEVLDLGPKTSSGRSFAPTAIPPWSTPAGATGVVISAGWNGGRMTIKKTKGEVCVWEFDDYHCYYDTDCGRAVCFENGGVKENNVIYCAYCGRKIKVVV